MEIRKTNPHQSDEWCVNKANEEFKQSRNQRGISCFFARPRQPGSILEAKAERILELVLLIAGHNLSLSSLSGKEFREYHRLIDVQAPPKFDKVVFFFFFFFFFFFLWGSSIPFLRCWLTNSI